MQKVKSFLSQILGFICIFSHTFFHVPRWTTRSVVLDDDNDKKVEDSSGRKNYGEIIGKAQWVDGKLGKALELDVKVLE